MLPINHSAQFKLKLRRILEISPPLLLFKVALLMFSFYEGALHKQKRVTNQPLCSQARKAMPGEEGHNPARGPGLLDGTGVSGIASF